MHTCADSGYTENLLSLLKQCVFVCAGPGEQGDVGWNVIPDVSLHSCQ